MKKNAKFKMHIYNYQIEDIIKKDLLLLTQVSYYKCRSLSVKKNVQKKS